MIAPNPIKQAWQASAGLPLLPRIEDIRRHAGRFDRQIRIRNGIEYGAGAIVLAFFSYSAIVETAPLISLAHLLIVLGTSFVMWQLWRRASVPKVPTSASTAELLRHYGRNLERQHHALKWAWLWYLLPFLPGMVLFQIATPAVPGKEWVKVVSVTIVASIFIGAWALNRAGARRLQRAIDELDQMSGESE